jgi:hypothetical protein
MGKTQEPSVVEAGNGSRGQVRGKGNVRGRPGPDVDAAISEAEHLTRDLARVRAKFATDPSLAPRSLEAAWMSDNPREEDEAEFVDTMADCLCAGLSLDDALTCWDRGDLVYDAAGDQAVDSDDEPIAPLVQQTARHVSPGGHRVLVR